MQATARPAHPPTLSADTEIRFRIRAQRERSTAESRRSWCAPANSGGERGSSSLARSRGASVPEGKALSYHTEGAFEPRGAQPTLADSPRATATARRPALP